MLNSTESLEGVTNPELHSRHVAGDRRDEEVPAAAVSGRVGVVDPVGRVMRLPEEAGRLIPRQVEDVLGAQIGIM